MRYSRIQDIKPSGKGNRGVIFFLSVFAIAAIVYFVGAANVGNFISKKLFIPAISWLTGKETEEPAKTTSSSGSSSSSPALKTTQVSIPGSTIYALQVGAYSQEENAKSVALSLQQKGGAGYVYEDSDVYRVFIAAYKTQSEAENVQSRLLSEQSMETKIYNIATNTVEFSITSDQNTIGYVQAAADKINTYQEILITLALDYDKGNVTISAVTSKAAELLTEVNTIQSNVGTVLAKSSNQTIEVVSNFYKAVSEALGKLTNDLDAVGMSAYIKEAYMSICFAKNSLVTALSIK